MTYVRCGTASCPEQGTVHGRYESPWNPAQDADVVYCPGCAEVLETVDLFTPARLIRDTP